MAIALLLLLIIGAVLLWQGGVGRFGWDVPRCAKCRYDLHGESGGEEVVRTACPECGRALTARGAVRYAKRRRSWRRAVLGAALILGVAGSCAWWPTHVASSLAWTAYRIGIRHPSINTMERRALSLLSTSRLIDELGGEASPKYLIPILHGRLTGTTGTWTARHDDELFDRLLKIEGDRQALWSARPMRQFLQAVEAQSSVAEERWVALVEARGAGLRAIMPARVAIGGRPFLETNAPYRSSSPLFASEFEVTTARFDGEDVPVYGGVNLQPPPLDELGMVEVELTGTWRARFRGAGALMTQPIFERPVTRRLSFEVLPRGAPTVERLTHPMYREQARESVQVRRVAIVRLRGELFVFVDWALAPEDPVAIAGEATLTLDGQEISLGRGASSNREKHRRIIGGFRTGFFPLAGDIDPSVRHATITLTPDDSDLPTHMYGFDPVWGEVISIEVDVERNDLEEAAP